MELAAEGVFNTIIRYRRETNRTCVIAPSTVLITAIATLETREVQGEDIRSPWGWLTGHESSLGTF